MNSRRRARLTFAAIGLISPILMAMRDPDTRSENIEDRRCEGAAQVLNEFHFARSSVLRTAESADSLASSCPSFAPFVARFRGMAQRLGVPARDLLHMHCETARNALFEDYGGGVQDADSLAISILRAKHLSVPLNCYPRINQMAAQLLALRESYAKAERYLHSAVLKENEPARTDPIGDKIEELNNEPARR